MTHKRIFGLITAIAMSIAPVQVCRAGTSPQPVTADVVVFGGTSAGVAAAVVAARGGSKVVMVESSYLIGGLTTGGLTKTDIGKPDTIGGFAREFYGRVLEYYTGKYGADSQQVKDCHGGFYFEPKVALQVYRSMLDEAGVAVWTKERLKDVVVTGGRIRSFTTRNYETDRVTRFEGAMFVDGSYEGDLMARAGALYRVGREARSEYDESLAGVTTGPEQYIGKGDHRVQAYNIRGTVSVDPDNRIPFPKPRHYYRDEHKGLIETVNRLKLTKVEDLFTDYYRWAMINGKGDPNRGDFPGVNFGYSEGDYEQRARITATVQDYWLSMWYMLQNDPELPEAFKANARHWGLPKDEYLESGHVTPQIYVRVARRLMGRYMLTQNDVLYERYKPDTVCMGSYNLDCHAIEHIQTDDGPVEEGGFNNSADAWEIPYRSLLPYGIDNLVVVAAVSATHVAYSSLRMEPVFMMLGHAGGAAANLAREENVAAQDISVAALQDRLRADKMPLKAPFRPVVGIRLLTRDPKPGEPVEFALVERHVESPLTSISWNFDGSGEVQATGKAASHTFTQGTHATVTVLVRDQKGLVALPAKLEVPVGDEPTLDREVHYLDAQRKGRWTRTRGPEIEYRSQVGLADEGPGGEPMSAVFSTVLPRTGRYLVAVAFPSGGNRATNTPIEITHEGGATKIALDQKNKPGPFAFQPVGEFRFKAGEPATVTFTNKGANGLVLIDTVRWIWLGE